MSQAQSKWYQPIPNAITSLNLIAGIFASFFAYEEKIGLAIIFLLMATIFDFLDGMVARLLKVSTKVGKELDSLADLISSGLLPGVLVFVVQRSLLNVQNNDFAGLSIPQLIFLFIPMMIPVASAIRLAKFNIDTRQTEEFIGMPTPANSIFWAAVAYDYFIAETSFFAQLYIPLVLTALIFLTSILLNTELRLLSLKFKNLRFKENAYRYYLLVGAVILLAIFWISGLALVVIFYILLSIIRNRLNR